MFITAGSTTKGIGGEGCGRTSAIASTNKQAHRNRENSTWTGLVAVVGGPALVLTNIYIEREREREGEGGRERERFFKKVESNITLNLCLHIVQFSIFPRLEDLIQPHRAILGVLTAAICEPALRILDGEAELRRSFDKPPALRRVYARVCVSDCAFAHACG